MTESTFRAASSLPTIADEDRLTALDSYVILDSPPEQGFDDIVELAAQFLQAPVALVSLVAEDRQWFKAKIGFPASETDLDSSVCAHVLSEPDLLVIPDLTADPRTRFNPLVMGDPHIRFYAGAPLRDRNGHVLGSLCVIDKAPRPGGLTEPEAQVLRNLGRQVVNLMELRRTVIGRDSFIARRRAAEQRLGEAHARLRISEAHWRGLFERLNEGFIIGEVIRDDRGRVADWRYLDVNAAWGELVDIDPAQAVGRTIREVFPGIEDEWVQEFARVVDSGEPVVLVRRVGVVQRWYEGRAFPLDEARFAVLLREVTDRISAEIRRNALLEIGDQLRDLASAADVTATASAIVGRALDASRVGYGRLDLGNEHVTIEPDWTAPGVTSIAGRHRFEDYGNIRRELLLGEPLIIRDTLTDSRTAGNSRPMVDIGVRSLVNIPIQERGRTVAVFLVHDTKPRDWEPETIAFLRNVADRLTASVARLQAEADQQLLNQELSHRMKNMLAMVQAIAWQTLKGVTEQKAVLTFRDRLQALASAHDVLLQTSWVGAPLDDIARAVLSQSSALERIDIDGPRVRFGPRATLSVSLLLHELATNAVKYGALSSETGRIGVTWRIDPAENALVFSWSETGGPPAREPTRLGFGTRLLRGGLIGTGDVVLRYLTTGFNTEMSAALEQVQS